MRAAGLPVDPTLVRPTPHFHRADGAWAMADLLVLDDPPDAVFCFSDLLAPGALRTILQAGLRVPQDIALAGFDDIEDGRYSTPSPTTISLDKTQIARHAVYHQPGLRRLARFRVDVDQLRRWSIDCCGEVTKMSPAPHRSLTHLVPPANFGL